MSTRKPRPGGVEVWREGAEQIRVWRARTIDGSAVWVRAEGVTHRVALEEWAQSSGGAAGSKANDLIAQFPGRVRKVLSQAGEAVEADQPLLMVEAMKMEFPIKAPYNGIVRKILVTEGDVLSPGQLLVDLERSSA